MRTIDIEQLPSLAIPVVNLIDNERPDIVIGCDRGARLFSLAVKAMWRELHDTPLPTVDNTMRFMRISSNYIGRRMLKNDLGEIIQSSTQSEVSAQALKILFIDDWTQTGAAYDAIQSVTQTMSPDISTFLGTMIGTESDAAGEPVPYSPMDFSIVFKDDPEQLGIDYTFTTEKQLALPVRSKVAIDNRKRLYAAARELGTAIRSS